MDPLPLGVRLRGGALATEAGPPTFEESVVRDHPEWDPDDNSMVELTQPKPELKSAEVKELPRCHAEHQRLQSASASERLRAVLQKALESRDPGPRVLLREELRRAENEVESLRELINCSRNLLQGTGKALPAPPPCAASAGRASSQSGSCSGKVTSPATASSSVSDSPQGDSLLFRECEAALQRSKSGNRVPGDSCSERIVGPVSASVSSSRGSPQGESLLLRESLQRAKPVPRPRSERRSARGAGQRAASCTSPNGTLLRGHAPKQSEVLLQRQEDRSKVLADIRWAMDEGYSAVGLKDLCSAQEQLAGAIRAARQNGIPEVELQEADKLRRSVHNQIEDLKGAIRVFCRVRPLNQNEVEQGDKHVCTSVDSMTVVVENYWERHQFMFDAVFLPGEQEEVFSECRDLIQSAMDGYNVSIFAYGQTSAGKTYTLFGGRGNPGLAPRVIREIFALASCESSRFSLTVTASMLELYRNDLVDLLSKSHATEASAAPKKLNIRTDKQGEVQVENLSEEECLDATQLLDLLERGNNERTVRATEMNMESSRSHLLLTIKLVRTNRETGDELRGKIQICDLAGSERLKKSMVSGSMAKEAIEINKSLTALGDVIEALTQGQKQIPFRNHKLTQVMQDSLGQSSKTLMFVNCSPASSNVEETLMSLKYATRVKKITSKSRRSSVQLCG